LGLLVLHGTACAHRPAAKQTPRAVQLQVQITNQTPEPPHWQDFVAHFIEEYLAAQPSVGVALGRHEFDGQLPDWSQDGIARHIDRLVRARDAALAYTDTVLSTDERFQRAYFVSRMNNELFWLRDARAPFVNPAYYFDAGLDPNSYVSMPYAPLEVRMRAFIEYARKIPNAIAQIRGNLAQPLPRTFIDYATLGFSGFAQFYRTQVPQVFAAVSSPELQEQLHAAIEPAAQAMLEIANMLESERPEATENFSLGAEHFAHMLAQTESVTTPLPELQEIAQKDLARNLSALETACRRYLPSGTLRACVDKEAADKPAAGSVSGARGQLATLKQFVIDHALVSIPSDAEALVEEAPPYQRQNFAYIDIPGPYERRLPAVYYIAPADPNWSAAEREAYLPGKADLLFTSVHEVWPGHYLQFLHANQSAWPFGRVFVGYAFAEGWAHYAEELMVEQGIATSDPGLSVGQLLNALLRNVRFVCALGLHTQNMSVEQCEELFRSQAFQDPGNARQQAARGTYDPAYLNYTLGKLMLRKLRSDWQAENPGRPIREFHDAVLDSGGPPIPLLRDRLLKQPGDQLF
jgi:hypothetical protein